jgi:hypothetical protein
VGTQVVCCERTSLLAAKSLAKGVLREYQRVHALAHSGTKGEQHRVHYRAGPTHVSLLCVGPEFELYATFDALTDKAAAVTICNRLCAWLHEHEPSLFMSHPLHFD